MAAVEAARFDSFYTNRRSDFGSTCSRVPHEHDFERVGHRSHPRAAQIPLPGNVPEITSLRESVCRASLLPAAQTALAGSCSCCRRCRPSTARRRQRSRPLGPLWQSVTEAAAAAGDGSDKCTTYSTKNDPPGNHLRKLSPQEARTSPTKPIPPSLTLPIGRWQQLAKSNMADKAKEGCSGGESRPFNDGADGRWRCRRRAHRSRRACTRVCVCGLVRPQRRRPLTLNPIREPELNYVFQRASGGRYNGGGDDDVPCRWRCKRRGGGEGEGSAVAVAWRHLSHTHELRLFHC